MIGRAYAGSLLHYVHPAARGEEMPIIAVAESVPLAVHAADWLDQDVQRKKPENSKFLSKLSGEDEEE